MLLLLFVLLIVVLLGLAAFAVAANESTVPERPRVVPPSPKTSPSPRKTRSTTVKASHSFTISQSVKLEIQKAMYQLEFWSRQYNLRLWPDARHRDDWEHDLGVMRMKRDLNSVKLELLDAGQKVLHEFCISFAHEPSRSKVVDSANGVEVLVLKPQDRARIAGHRLTVNWSDGPDSIRHLLRLNWTTVPKLDRHSQRKYESEHARRITGGRLHGAFRVDRESRHLLQITNTGSRGFAFADSVENDDLQRVFCHEKFAPEDFAFQPGRKIWAVVVQTPRGLQARSIEAAA